MFESTFFKREIPTLEDQNRWFSIRDGEVKIGEKCHYYSVSTSWVTCKFHILGIKEDIGPRLNLGRPGAANAFESFISRFLNIQSNQFLSGESICIHGALAPKTTSGQIHSGMIDDLDQLVSTWVEEVVRIGGIPIVIGGGHNNAFPLIKGVSNGLNEAIHVVNMDPHADTRKTGQRHSGNPFSSAYEQKYLKEYAVLGLHESYNNQYILDSLKEMKAFATFYESWLEKPFQFQADIDKVYDHFFQHSTGIELDMDSIAWMPSSAFTPSGISLDQARFYIRKMATLNHVCYLHLPEAAPVHPQEEIVVGKSLAYLVADFVKEYMKHHV